MNQSILRRPNFNDPPYVSGIFGPIQSGTYLSNRVHISYHNRPLHLCIIGHKLWLENDFSTSYNQKKKKMYLICLLISLRMLTFFIFFFKIITINKYKNLYSHPYGGIAYFMKYIHLVKIMFFYIVRTSFFHFREVNTILSTWCKLFFLYLYFTLN